MNRSDICIGIRVVYVQNAYGVGPTNPLVGTKFECEGIVYDVSGQTCYVRWDNGSENDYSYKTLELVKPSKDPNILFKRRKNTQ